MHIIVPYDAACVCVCIASVGCLSLFFDKATAHSICATFDSVVSCKSTSVTVLQQAQAQANLLLSNSKLKSIEFLRLAHGIRVVGIMIGVFITCKLNYFR